MRYHVSAKELGINTSRLVKTKFLGHWKSAFKGEGITFADIRAYTWGDPRKRIDRLTTAKKGELYIKEYEEERQLNIVMAVDIAKSMDFASSGKSKKKVAQELLAIVSYAATSFGDLWGALLFDDERVAWHRPRKGMRSYFAAEHTSQYYQSNVDYSDVSSAVQTLLDNKVHHSLIFLICDDWVTNCPGLRALAHDNDIVFVHCFDEFEMSLSGAGRHGTLGTGEQHRTVWLGASAQSRYAERFEAKRKVTEQYVIAQGCSYCSLSTADDPVGVLVEFFMKKAHHSR